MIRETKGTSGTRFAPGRPGVVFMFVNGGGVLRRGWTAIGGPIDVVKMQHDDWQHGLHI